MNKDEISELEPIIKEYCQSRNIELVDFVYRYEGRNLVLRLLVDKPEGGITLDECAKLNIQISTILGEKEPIQDRYALEVCSPGADRPLVTKNDFLRCANRNAWFLLKSPIKGKIELQGLIKSVNDESVQIDTEKETIEVHFSNIIKAKQRL